MIRFDTRSMSLETATWLNYKYVGRAHVMVADEQPTDRAMWNACFARAFMDKRRQLGLGIVDSGALLLAHRPAHEMWADMRIVNVQHLEPVLEGGAATSQPCSAIHRFHSQMFLIISTSSSAAAETGIAPRPRPISSVHTNITRSCHVRHNDCIHPVEKEPSPAQIVELNIACWEALPVSLTRWAWTSRGLCSCEDMAKCHDTTEEEILGDGAKARRLHFRCSWLLARYRRIYGKKSRHGKVSPPRRSRGAPSSRVSGI